MKTIIKLDQIRNESLRLLRQSIELTPFLSVSLKIHVPSTSSKVQLAGVSANVNGVNNPTINTTPKYRSDFNIMKILRFYSVRASGNLLLCAH